MTRYQHKFKSQWGVTYVGPQVKVGPTVQRLYAVGQTGVCLCACVCTCVKPMYLLTLSDRKIISPWTDTTIRKLSSVLRYISGSSSSSSCPLSLCLISKCGSSSSFPIIGVYFTAWLASFATLPGNRRKNPFVLFIEFVCLPLHVTLCVCDERVLAPLSSVCMRM